MGVVGATELGCEGWSVLGVFVGNWRAGSVSGEETVGKQGATLPAPSDPSELARVPGASASWIEQNACH